MKNYNFKIPYVNLYKQNKPYIPKLKSEFTKLINSGQYILGDSVNNFEREFAKYVGTKYAIGVGSGTDALYLSLRYLNLNKNDEVITVSNSYLSTVSSIYLAGAKPILADVNYENYNIDIKSIEKEITKNSKVILPVHLCGRPADMDKILKLANKYKLKVIEDAAQAVGATIGKKKVGSFGLMGCFSFHPLKNLNAIGDGGMVVTNNKKIYDWISKARNLGHLNRNQCDFWSHNMRLDAIQSVFLKIKLRDYENVIAKRRKNVDLYMKNLCENVVYPSETKKIRSVYQTFIVKVKKRAKLINFLKKNGVEAKIHYPVPIHKLRSFKKTNKQKIKLQVTERLSKEILTLPAMEYIKKKQIKKICNLINKFFKKK